MKRLALYFLLPLLAVWVSAKETVPATRPASERFGKIQSAEEPSFRRHVLPLMSRTGCSGRECHGSFSGQGGFQLSLFGYSFDKDHQEITADTKDNVRVDLENPEKSLVLLKPTMQEKHKGKERIKKGSWEYNVILKWIQTGAKLDADKTGEFGRLEILPKEVVFKKAGDSVQLRVLAYWKDGTVEDVTLLTRFRTNDETVSTVTETGLVLAKEPGDTHIVAFYDNGVLPVPVLQPVTAKNGSNYPKVAARTKVDELVVGKLRKLGVIPSDNCTDTEFLRRVSLDMSGTLPTPDEVTKFLADKSSNKRSAKVDELLKSPGYAAWWATRLNDSTGNNPRRLQVGNQGVNGDTFSRQWYDWIYKRVSENEPYDKLAAGIILATGRTKPEQSYKEFATEMGSYFRNEERADFAGRPNMPYFWQRQNVRKPEEKALAFAHSFLGVRIECAECHKHPFDQWTQTDFKQFQAFFEPIQYGTRPGAKDEEVTFQTATKSLRDSIGTNVAANAVQKMQAEAFRSRLDKGEVLPWQEVFISGNSRPNLTPKQLEALKARNANMAGRVLTPKILGGGEVPLGSMGDPRVPLMEWLRSKDNPYFARSFVNRVWANYFGRGIVEPADDMNLANPPVNKELLDYLSDGFVSHGYDMKWLHREIVNSDTYQRSWKPTASNKLDDKNFSRYVIRRLPAEIVIDAISQATASTEALPKFSANVMERAIGPNVTAYGRGNGARATTDYALNLFGKPVRETNCDCERTADPTLLQTIYTRNDPEFLARIETARRNVPSWIEELNKANSASKGKPVGTDSKPELNIEKLITEAFLRTVSRVPTAVELAQGKADIAAAKDTITGLRDLLWAMLNTREFMVNH